VLDPAVAQLVWPAGADDTIHPFGAASMYLQAVLHVDPVDVKFDDAT
jgi:hypothetical protein